MSARAPLIIVDPRKKTSGQVCPRTVEFVDLYPTLVDLCGLTTPPGLEGTSLVPLLDHPMATWNKPAFTLVAREEWLAQRADPTVVYTEWDEGRYGTELYDLQADPRESRNLSKVPQHASIVAELKTFLHRGPVAKQSPVRAVRTAAP